MCVSERWFGLDVWQSAVISVFIEKFQASGTKVSPWWVFSSKAKKI